MTDHPVDGNRRSIGIRQVRADVAALVRRAEAGEQILISVGGRPTAQLGPISPTHGHVALEDLIAQGRVRAPRRTGDFRPADPVSVWSGSRIDRLLREIR